MLKTRKIPLRKCVITQERHPKQDLIRIVKTNDNEVFIDPTGKKNGRGAYLKKTKSVILKAQKTQKLARHLETEIPDTLYVSLLEMLENGDI